MICARCKTILPHVASSSDYCSACGDFLRLQQKHDTLRTELDKVLFDYDDLVQRNKTIHAELEEVRSIKDGNYLLLEKEREQTTCLRQALEAWKQSAKFWRRQAMFWNRGYCEDMGYPYRGDNFEYYLMRQEENALKGGE